MISWSKPVLHLNNVISFQTGSRTFFTKKRLGIGPAEGRKFRGREKTLFKKTANGIGSINNHPGISVFNNAMFL
jgi:hypothetical protein